MIVTRRSVAAQWRGTKSKDTTVLLQVILYWQILHWSIVFDWPAVGWYPQEDISTKIDKGGYLFI